MKELINLKYKNCKLTLNSFLQTTFKKYCFIDTLQKKHEERKIEIHRKTHQTLRFLQPKAFFDLSLERILFIFDEIPDLTIVFPSWKIDPFKFNKLRFVFPSGKSSWHPWRFLSHRKKRNWNLHGRVSSPARRVELATNLPFYCKKKSLSPCLKEHESILLFSVGGGWLTFLWVIFFWVWLIIF